MHEQVVALLPRRTGHFLLESGHHSRVWLDLELLFAQPDRVDPLAVALADLPRDARPTAVCGPLVEGAFVALRVAAMLGVPFSYSMPTPADDGDHARRSELFPVDYPIPVVLQERLRGERVVVVNDVINAGSAVRGTLASLDACGAHPVAIGALAVYGDAAARLATAHGARLETLATLPSETWEPGDCPLCARRIPLEPFPS